MCQIAERYWATTKVKLVYRNNAWYISHTVIALFKGPRLGAGRMELCWFCASTMLCSHSLLLLEAKVQFAASANGWRVLKIHHQTHSKTRKCINMLHWHVETHLPSRVRAVPKWIKTQQLKPTSLLEEKHVDGPSPFHGDAMNCWPVVGSSAGMKRDQN